VKLITGANGLLGSCFSSLEECHTPSCDLLVDDFEKQITNDIECVIHCAAVVGGLQANMENIADFFVSNMKININVLDACKKKNVKLLSIMSTCIYPSEDFVSYPLTENQLHMGPPHDSNFGYAYAKRMLDVMSKAYRQQYGSNFITVIPNNLYGTNDNYKIPDGHVIPSLIRRIYEAKIQNEKSIVIWGSGKPIREFTFAPDAAKIILWLANNYDEAEPVNIGNPDSISIKDLAYLLVDIIKFEGEIVFDQSKSDGQYQKPCSNQKLQKLGWEPCYTPLRAGLEKTISHFIKEYPNVRGYKK